MKIKVLIKDPLCAFARIAKGEYIDLHSEIDVKLKAPKASLKSGKIAFDTMIIPLGIAMTLPKYFEAIVVARSSTLRNFHFMLSNAFGVIDHTFCGDKDIWGCPVIAMADGVIKKGDRICQFRIQPSQFAPWWVKVKWLFTNSITFVGVQTLGNENRGGFGHTGKQ